MCNDICNSETSAIGDSSEDDHLHLNAGCPLYDVRATTASAVSHSKSVSAGSPGHPLPALPSPETLPPPASPPPPYQSLVYDTRGSHRLPPIVQPPGHNCPHLAPSPRFGRSITPEPKQPSPSQVSTSSLEQFLSPSSRNFEAAQVSGFTPGGLSSPPSRLSRPTHDSTALIQPSSARIQTSPRPGLSSIPHTSTSPVFQGGPTPVNESTSPTQSSSSSPGEYVSNPGVNGPRVVRPFHPTCQVRRAASPITNLRPFNSRNHRTDARHPTITPRRASRVMSGPRGVNPTHGITKTYHNPVRVFHVIQSDPYNVLPPQHKLFLELTPENGLYLYAATTYHLGPPCATSGSREIIRLIEDFGPPPGSDAFRNFLGMITSAKFPVLRRICLKTAPMQRRTCDDYLTHESVMTLRSMEWLLAVIHQMRGGEFAGAI